MPAQYDVVLRIVAPGVPPDVISHAQQQLVDQFNERAPIADFLRQNRQEGTKGDVELIGHIGLALLSANVLKHIATVIIEFARRNKRYSIEVGDVKITKDHATAKDMDHIEKQLHAIMLERRKSDSPR
jgi:hypothetical protein